MRVYVTLATARAPQLAGEAEKHTVERGERAKAGDVLCSSSSSGSSGSSSGSSGSSSGIVNKRAEHKKRDSTCDSGENKADCGKV